MPVASSVGEIACSQQMRHAPVGESMGVALVRGSILGNQPSVAMRFCAGLSRAEFALLARPSATSWTTDSLHLFEGRLLALHGCR
jgi:hypothetical protein